MATVSYINFSFKGNSNFHHTCLTQVLSKQHQVPFKLQPVLGLHGAPESQGIWLQQAAVNMTGCPLVVTTDANLKALLSQAGQKGKTLDSNFNPS